MSVVIDHIQHLAATDGARPALECSGRSISYAQLWQAVQHLSQQLGQTTSRIIATDITSPVAWMIADLALIRSQSVHIPLPPFFTPAQKNHAMHSAGADGLLSDTCLDLGRPEGIMAADGADLFLYSLKGEAVSLHDGTAKITYTSGTTGTPKGVCLSQSAMETVARSLLVTLGDDDASHFGGLLPLAVLLENIAGFYTVMLGGGCYHVMPPAPLTDFTAIAAFLEEKHITSCILVPELLRGLLQELEQNPRSFPAMRYMAVGGAKVAPELLERSARLGLSVYQGYGLSESSSVTCLNVPADNRIGTIGKPLPHIRISLSPEGEIIIDDPLFLGYTGENAAPRHYATGDLGHFDSDGFLSITGRIKNVLINSSGRNISPEWPESQLLAQPAIDQALVIGDARPCLAALIVSRQDDTRIEHAITRANDALPDYARIRHWRKVSAFSVANGLLTGTGRPKRTAITKHFHTLIESIFNQETPMEPFFKQLEHETRIERNKLLQNPLLRDALQGNISKQTYLAYLEQAYHHVKHTTPLLMACGSRLPSSKEWLRAAIAEYIEEELGHQEWILNDIAQCGGDAEAIRRGQPNMATEMMVAYAYDSVMRKNPASFFGMVYVLEGTSINLATGCAEAIGRSLGLSDNCFSYLISHGTLDLSHMEFFEGLMNRISDPDDQTAIIHMAKYMFGLFDEVFNSIPHTQKASHAA